MMNTKKLFLFLGIPISILAVAGMATAMPFSVTVDFDDYTLPFSGKTVALLIDSPFIENVPYEFSFDLDLDPVGGNINSATLSLTHWGNTSLFSPEIWLMTSSGGIEIGQLSASGWGIGWVTDIWGLSPELLQELKLTDPWSLTVVIDELTEGIDFLVLDEAKLFGDYTPVPVPTSLLLLGSGLLGLLAIRRTKKP